jgi:hypothetical protein
VVACQQDFQQCVLNSKGELTMTSSTAPETSALRPQHEQQNDSLFAHATLLRVRSKARRTTASWRGFWLAVLLLVVAPLTAPAQSIVYSSPFGGGGDLLHRGFYLTSFGGSNLGTVTLGYYTTVDGLYTTSLTARLGAFDGALIGSTQTLNTFLGTGMTLVTYDFGGASVAAGSVVTFTQELIGGPSSSVFFDYGTGTLGAPGSTGIVETGGTTAPLDEFRRSTVGVIVTQVQTVPEPSTFLLVGASLVGVVAFRKRARGQSQAA